MTVSHSSKSGAGLGNRALLDKMDKLREIGIQEMVPLPQMVVVGDQSAGKSSVLESLTGFHFPRNVTLCTRHATEIICRREESESIVVSIQPVDADVTKAKNFRRQASNLDAPEFEKIFSDAAQVMGIKSGPDDIGSAFSRDILRVEISGPNEDHLTVIDVPGMFENETPGLTTKNDINLVKEMVKRYINESRTIILAVVPCNMDIANQKILTYAKEADPDGKRTLGVLTKPDLAVENATKEQVVDLVLGRRRDLQLGYCVVKNRGADDTSSSAEKRDCDEKSFFQQSPWTRLPADKLGIPALKSRIQQLLMNRTKSEFPKVRAELTGKLKSRKSDLQSMGRSRSTPDQQRIFIGEVASKFARIKDQGLDAYYNRSKIFSTYPDLKLITRIREINERFSVVVYEKGHTRVFTTDGEKNDKNDQEDDVAPGADVPDEDDEAVDENDGIVTCPIDGDFNRDDLYDNMANFKIPLIGEEDLDGLLAEPYRCSVPSNDDILSYIEHEYMTSRGDELGTFSGEMLPTSFKEQSKKWSPMARAHVSNAILIVHDFIRTVLDECCPEPEVHDALWNFLLEDLQKRYQRAMDHAEFLLDVEFQGTSMTYNPAFWDKRDKAKRARNERKTAKELEGLHFEPKSSQILTLKKFLESALEPGDPVKTTRQDIHDVLVSYYDIARSRFVDVLCQQVIHHYLLHAPDSPLNVLSDTVVLKMSDDQLDTIAGEDMISRERRKKLTTDIENLRQALKILRA
ncbi:P-loop containing nucleoside triphosphate hydrolase protein [Dactylonectria estremocensis]|uniref:P-loop containing nucleoside triphosphate hydrolase protein n=1 Tax=Dactylonectria estremocensis TaxID=1079267 RepID=A0A9P9FF45_9HYPO|nr:P-loop containing nucleoside triphosphate hydrolase protein [Dactylonectria estremocensis]